MPHRHHDPHPHPHPPKHHPPHHTHHHHQESFLDALDSIVRAGKAETTAELVRYTELLHEPEAAAFLQKHLHRRPQLALAALRVELELGADDRHAALIDRCAATPTGLVLPLPHHILDLFDPLPNRTLLVGGGHALPPHLRGQDLSVVEGSHACRAVLPQFNVLIFEAHRENGTYNIAPEVADIIDLRIIPIQTLLVLHLRGHEHVGDIQLSHSAHEVIVL